MYLSYYRGRGKQRIQEKGEKYTKEAEIDLVIEADGKLYPVEIRKSENPKLSMTNAFDVLDRVSGKHRGTGAIICLYDKPLWLNERIVALPVEYL